VLLIFSLLYYKIDGLLLLIYGVFECGDKVIRKLIRCYVSKHIYLKEIKIDLCGFCSKVCGQNIGLIINTDSSVPVSDCLYKFRFSLKAAEKVSSMVS
jgi:hypothetical protein